MSATLSGAAAAVEHSTASKVAIDTVVGAAAVFSPVWLANLESIGHGLMLWGGVLLVWLRIIGWIIDRRRKAQAERHDD